MKPLLSIRNLHVHFKTYRGVVKALNGVNFDIYENEFFGLVGETGCGKSVTALSILRLIPKTGKIVSGEIIFEGENLLNKTEKEMTKIRGSKISMIFQDPSSSLNPVYTVGEKTSETIFFHSLRDKKKAWEEAVKLFRLVGLPSPEKRMKNYPHELSGGMKQRVMIAMALSCHPNLLIADEPTTSLDVTIQAQIIELMKDLQKKFKTSVLLITHDLGLIAETCNRAGVMYAGTVVEIGYVRDLFDDPKHPYTKGLLEAIPPLIGNREMLSTIPGFVPDMINPPTGCPFHPRCKRKTGVCIETKPEMTIVGNGHLVACHHPVV